MQFRNFLNFLFSLIIIYSLQSSVPLFRSIFVEFSVCIVSINLADWLMTVTRKYILHKQVNPRNKAVLITGCDSGFGNLLARRLDKLGYKVFAACLNTAGQGAKELSNSCSKNLTIFPMDVTNDKDIQAAKDFVTENLGKYSLWAVVNNSGISRLGEIDWTPPEEFQTIYDVNVVGMLKVTKTFLPFLKKSRGRIVNITSKFGRWMCPALIPYCMSKSAAIALTTGLRIELAKWGVKAISIEPFLYKTSLTTEENASALFRKAWKETPEDIKKEYGEDYKDKCTFNGIRILGKRVSLKVHEVIDCLEDAIAAKEPLNTYSPSSTLDKIIVNLSLILPNVIIEHIQRSLMERGTKPLALSHRR